MTSLADSGLLIAAINRGDRHHRWAVNHLIAEREANTPIIVPQTVIGETFTKLRYDKRVSPRRDAGVALGVFAMVDENPDTFRTIATPASAHDSAGAILARYKDHSFSYIDAVIFHMVDHDPAASRILTVDGADFRSFRFAHPVEIVTP